MAREETIQQIYEAMGLMKRCLHTSFHPFLEQLDISPAQIDLLFTIAHEQPISPKKLATKLQLTPGAVSQLLAGLQQSRSITYTTDPDDRRVSYVRVSKQGEGKLAVLRQLRQQYLTEAFERLSDSELEHYLRLQQKLLQHFNITPEHKKETA